MDTASWPWSTRLLELLVDELYVDEEVASVFGDLSDISPASYPQVVAVALAARHSWRLDDFRRFSRRLGLPLRTGQR